ncbi:MAG: OmpA family protein, partial [Cyclobacteriaceae bacterium]|nr:OmpA family protein [Cyclobacteriaceae bacterium]
GYAFTSTTLDLEKGKVDEINLKLQKLEKDALLTLRDILFESNSSQLSDISFTELRRVIQLMKENPNLKVEVAAHTDDIGSDPYNKALSEKRAESVVQFMIDNQISEDRLVAKGYGESSPKVPNESDESRSVNRRVELKILGV